MAIFDLDEKIEGMSVKEVLNFLTDEQKKELIELLKKKDKIFLLSAKEYEEHKSKIPCLHEWWLRSPGSGQDYIAFVLGRDSVGYTNDIASNNGCVRPAIRYNEFKHTKVNETTVCALGVTWKILDDNIAIAEMPIFYSRFDARTNDYEQSEVRKKLLAWAEEREDW